MVAVPMMRGKVSCSPVYLIGESKVGAVQEYVLRGSRGAGGVAWVFEEEILQQSALERKTRRAASLKPHMASMLVSSAGAVVAKTSSSRRMPQRNKIVCVGWDPEGILGPPQRGHIARIELKRRLEKDAVARDEFDRQLREEREQRRKRREARVVPETIEGLIEYFLDTEAREIEVEIARLRPRLNKEFFDHVQAELGQLRFAINKTTEVEDRLVELEAMQKVLLEGTEAYDKMQIDLFSAKERLMKILQSKDRKSTVLEMVEKNELNRSILALLDENIASAHSSNQTSPTVEYGSKEESETWIVSHRPSPPSLRPDRPLAVSKRKRKIRAATSKEAMPRTMHKDTENHDNNNQKVYPQPVDESANQNKESMDVLIRKIFNNISSLKAAYIQLQDAHTPYDPDKIHVADKLVIEELMKLSELKHSYREKNPKLMSSSSKDAYLLAEIQEQQSLLKTYETMVKKFQSQIQTRDSEIVQIQQQIQESDQIKLKLEKKLKQRGLLSKEAEGVGEENNFFSVELTPGLFSSAVDTAYKSIHDFSKPLINMMKAAGWDLDAAANAIEPAVVYSKRVHKKYAFESHICQKMFSGFQEENFSMEPSNISGSHESFFHQFLAVRSMDPLDILSQNPDSVFGKFSRKKYLMVVHPKMEASFFGNLDQRNHVMNGGHPRTPFYQAFLKLAKSVWLLHRLAYSFDPRVKIFKVSRGTQFSEVYMESVVKNIILAEGESSPEVGLMVMPGFMIGGSVVQSQVYLSGVSCAE
ncbi:IRK-interacting protein-like isoform X1 [Canna indica]|uniref:IRK-interacting protein-like isoform X1 n=1 Tax=Canna indica TaxID=4628 RepID=A0AAQ3KJ77_9LILI|nr:IRK-interacting protein-like isoform X1 [Canna indica]